jgi:hypothetical protein
MPNGKDHMTNHDSQATQEKSQKKGCKLQSSTFV